MTGNNGFQQVVHGKVIELDLRVVIFSVKQTALMDGGNAIFEKRSPGEFVVLFMLSDFFNHMQVRATNVYRSLSCR